MQNTVRWRSDWFWYICQRSWRNNYLEPLVKQKWCKFLPAQYECCYSSQYWYHRIFRPSHIFGGQFTVLPLCSSFFQTMKAHWTMISQIVSLEMMAIKKEPAYFFPRHWWLSCLKRVSPYFKGFRISRPFSLLGDLTTVFVKKKKIWWHHYLDYLADFFF